MYKFLNMIIKLFDNEITKNIILIIKNNIEHFRE